MDAASKLWNELSYERRQEYFEARRRGMSQWASLKHVDLRGTRKKHVPKYAEVLFYFEGRIARLESEAAHAKAGGDEVKYYKLWAEVRRLKRKWTARRLHLYRNLASHLIHELWERGVSTVYVGYPYDIAQERGNKYSVNIWAYRELVGAIEAKAREYGIAVYEVFERGTSSQCAYHEVAVKRYPRGAITCPAGGHRLHSDLNGALDILRRGSGVLINGNLKPLSFIVDHNGVVPTNSIASTKGGNAQNPGTYPT
ncbi:MAG: transposase [Conexivisphaera sp.]